MINSTIQYNTIQYNTIQYNKYNTVQYNTIQYNTIQYNTIQHNTIQYKEFTNWDPERSLLDLSKSVSSCFCMRQFGSDLVKSILDDMISHETSQNDNR